MIHPEMMILYVADVERSAVFYAELFDCAPVEASANFAMFVFPSGLKLGLWARSGVLPAPQVDAGASELVLALDGPEQLQQLFADWLQRGVVIAQSPTAMDFGLTFVALDPDQHRLRVFVAAA
jgi:predicted enzyme related to lactoylglutathione lyase